MLLTSNPHSQSHQDVADALEVNITTGLTSTEAAARLEEYGPNKLPEEKNPAPCCDLPASSTTS